jgi:hypothetical protein
MFVAYATLSEAIAENPDILAAKICGSLAHSLIDATERILGLTLR